MRFLLLSLQLLCHFLLPVCVEIPNTLYRTLDGSGNNLDHPTWGAAYTALQQFQSLSKAVVNTSDVIKSPNPRLVSTTLAEALQKRLNRRLLNNAHTSWGHFLVLDLSATAVRGWNPIPVPACDPYFDAGCTGKATLPFLRSASVMQDGTPRPYNEISSYLDGSMVYGTDAAHAAALRTLKGGRMAVTETGEPPYNTAGLRQLNPMGCNLSEFRMMGDFRSNITPQMLALQAIFLREHNRYCHLLGRQNPKWDDERLYQEARRRVVAHIQHITYREYLPAMLGAPLPLYAGYDATVDATLSDFYSACGGRYGHPEVNGVVLRLTESWVESPGGHLRLFQSFLNPTLALSEGIEPILRGMLFSSQFAVEALYKDDLQDHLWDSAKSRNATTDLMATDIQRSRDYALPKYGAAREAFGLRPYATFEELTGDSALAHSLRQLYGTVGDLDPIIGALLEEPQGGSLGELFRASVSDHFHRLRAGDRFWYENGQFSALELQGILNTTLVDIMNRNTGVGYMMRHAFFRHDAQLDGGMFGVPMPHFPELEVQYHNVVQLDRGFRLYWTVEEQQGAIRFAVVARSGGWVGLGLSAFDSQQPLQSAMYDVDMTIGRLVQGEGHVADYFSFELGVPSLDTDIGCENDLRDVSFEVNGSHRVMRFTKPLESLDSAQPRGRLGGGADVVKAARSVACDTAVRPNVEYYLIFAVHPVDDALIYHGASRGVGRVVLHPKTGWLPLHTLIAGGIGLLVFALLLVAAVLLLMHRRRGKDNANAPREPPFCILFTDLEQSTKLWALDQLGMAQLIEGHTSAIRGAIARHGAYEVKTIGDSFMIITKEAESAVHLAVDIQLSLYRWSWSPRVLNLVEQAYGAQEPWLPVSDPISPGTRPWHGPRVRIGVHYADEGSGVQAELDEVSGSYDYYGTPVNTAARIEGLARGGQILISASVLQQCLALRDNATILIKGLGHVPVRGLPQNVELYEVTPSVLRKRSFAPIRQHANIINLEPADQTMDPVTSNFHQSTNLGCSELCPSTSFSRPPPISPRPPPFEEPSPPWELGAESQVKRITRLSRTGLVPMLNPGEAAEDTSSDLGEPVFSPLTLRRSLSSHLIAKVHPH